MNQGDGGTGRREGEVGGPGKERRTSMSARICATPTSSTPPAPAAPPRPTLGGIARPRLDKVIVGEATTADEKGQTCIRAIDRNAQITIIRDTACYSWSYVETVTTM